MMTTVGKDVESEAVWSESSFLNLLAVKRGQTMCVLVYHRRVTFFL